MNALALSPMQMLMWTGQQLHPAAPLYNMGFTFTVHGPIDPQRFDRAFAALVRLSPTLRTVIQAVRDVPTQQVLDSPPPALDHLDLSSAPDADAAVRAWVDARLQQPFALERRLYDSALIRVGAQRWVWYFAQHHIVMDVTSMALTFEHLSALYAQDGLTDGPTVTVPPFADFLMHAGQADTSDFWEARAQAAPPIPTVYRALSSSAPPLRERRTLTLDPARMSQLNRLAAEPGLRAFSRDLTLMHLFTAAYAAWIHRLSGARSLRIGTPFANRTTPAFRHTPGLFIEMGALDLTLDTGETFAALVSQIRAEILRVLHQVQPGMSSAALNRSFGCVLNYITVRFGAFAGMPCEAEWLHSGAGDGIHPLSVQVYDLNGADAFTIAFDFHPHAFTATEQARAMRHFLQVWDACFSDPHRAIGTIDLLDDDDRARLRAFNNTTRPARIDRTVIDLFEAQAATTPEAIALAHDGSTLSYAALNTRVNALAAQLGAAGVGPGVLVPVCVDHSFALVIALLAVMKAGGAYVPLDPTHPDARLRLILDDLHGAAPLVLTHARHHARFAGASQRVITVSVTDPPPDSLPNPARAAAPGDLAYVMYTSGTTGIPKGVMIQHDGLSQYLLWASAHYTSRRPATFALYSPIVYDLTVTTLYVPLITGGTLRIYREEGQRGTLIRDVIADNQVDVLKLTPSHLALVRDLDLRQSRIRCLIVGGEDFKTEIARDVDRRSGGQIVQYNEYGPTEATVACMIHRFDPERDQRPSVPVGVPTDNMRVYVVDSFMQPVPIGIIGEMVISGVQVARGYWRRADRTAEQFMADPFYAGARLYRTGDLARWLEDGTLEYLGRVDHQVKIGGVRIELAEIEMTLMQHPAIREAVVERVSIPAAPHQPDSAPMIQLAAYYTADAPLNADVIRHFLAERLTATLIPTYFVPLERIPLSSSGKIDRSALPPIDRGASSQAGETLTSDAERAIAAIWSDVLRRGDIGAHDDFFALGGHSLAAIRIARRIGDLFAVQVPLETFFAHPTVSGQARAVEAILIAEIAALDEAAITALLEQPPAS